MSWYCLARTAACLARPPRLDLPPLKDLGRSTARLFDVGEPTSSGINGGHDNSTRCDDKGISHEDDAEDVGGGGGSFDGGPYAKILPVLVL